MSTITETLPQTDSLQQPEDLSALMVQKLDQFLMQAIDSAASEQAQYWSPDEADPESYQASIQPNRERLKQIIGCLDQRSTIDGLELIATTQRSVMVAETDTYTVQSVRWPVFEEVYGEGLLVEPKSVVQANLIVIPDADQTLEAILGLTNDLPKSEQFGKSLAGLGCRLVIPTLIDRTDTYAGNSDIGRWTNQPHREFIYRMAFELGRHLIGYEVQKILAVVEWFQQMDLPIGLFGYGEGGLLAFYTAAVEPQIESTVVSGYFNSRQRLWQEPIYRNVWGLLRGYDDAELTRLIAPRHLIVEASHHPAVDGPPPVRDGRGGAAPGQIITPGFDQVKREAERAQQHFDRLSVSNHLQLVQPAKSVIGDAETVSLLARSLGVSGGQPPASTRIYYLPSAEERQQRQFQQLVKLAQRHLLEAASRRKVFFWDQLDDSSPQAWQQSCQPLKACLWDEVIGRCPSPEAPAHPRSRLLYDQPNWTGYEVMLDVWDLPGEETNVFASGILLLPKGIQAGEKRPVVVCQHGLEGRSHDTCDPEITGPYNAYGAKLADLGFVVYAPQNPYIGQDQFRVLQRKANPLKWSLFSLIVRQHEQTLDWLAGLDFVDPERIGFYGLSYGGKTAMRVPALLDRYALSICSADFNEWIVKNATYHSGYSYIFTGEYEMPEFDLGNTFNYAEMAVLIAPRPFMVERGHHDGVAPDEWVAHEYAIVRRAYVGLGIGDRTEIEFFDSGHEINGQGTFAFLKRHLSHGSCAE